MSMEKIKKTLAFTAIALNFIIMIGGAMVVYQNTIGYEPVVITEEQAAQEFDALREKRESQPIVYTMDKFTVNLDGLPKRIIQTEISLEMLDEKGFEEVVNISPRARDAIVRILNSKQYYEVETLQGKLFLKDQITTALNQFMDDGVVKEVYFNEFIVQ